MDWIRELRKIRLGAIYYAIHTEVHNSPAYRNAESDENKLAILISWTDKFWASLSKEERAYLRAFLIDELLEETIKKD